MTRSRHGVKWHKFKWHGCLCVLACFAVDLPPVAARAQDANIVPSSERMTPEKIRINGFAKFPKPDDVTIEQHRQHAIIANHVYENRSGNRLSSGIAVVATWKQLVSLAGLGEVTKTIGEKSGFNAALYQKPDGNLILAFEGSLMMLRTKPRETFKDWVITNVPNGFNLWKSTLIEKVMGDKFIKKLSRAPQFAMAEIVAKISKDHVEKMYPGQTLTFVGHSLGGGLAQTASSATGLPAVVFNPEGSAYIRTTERGTLNALVTQFWTADRVNSALYQTTLPGQFGLKYYLGIGRHGMNDTLQLMRIQDSGFGPPPVRLIEP